MTFPPQSGLCIVMNTPLESSPQPGAELICTISLNFCSMAFGHDCVEQHQLPSLHIFSPFLLHHFITILHLKSDFIFKVGSHLLPHFTISAATLLVHCHSPGKGDILPNSCPASPPVITSPYSQSTLRGVLVRWKSDCARVSSPVASPSLSTKPIWLHLQTLHPFSPSTSRSAPLLQPSCF